MCALVTVGQTCALPISSLQSTFLRICPNGNPEQRSYQAESGTCERFIAEIHVLCFVLCLNCHRAVLGCSCRYQTVLGLTAEQTRLLTRDPETSRYFEEAIAAANVDATEIADWIVGVMEGHLHAMNMNRSEEHTSELQSLMRISYAVF